MIGIKLDDPQVDAAKRFREADPFPHVVIDDFWRESWVLRHAEDELRAMNVHVSPWVLTGGDRGASARKYTLNVVGAMPPTARTIMTWLNSTTCLRWLEELTGIKDLLPDHGLWGGGVHQTFEGGRLAIHADFNRHPTLHWHRRLNLLLYMNRGGSGDISHGALELWDRDMKNLVQYVEPEFNRCVVFETGPTSYHGHPSPWVAYHSCPTRLSLATYYYTERRAGADDFAPFRDVQWQRRPGKGL